MSTPAKYMWHVSMSFALFSVPFSTQTYLVRLLFSTAIFWFACLCCLPHQFRLWAIFLGGLVAWVYFSHIFIVKYVLLSLSVENVFLTFRCLLPVVMVGQFLKWHSEVMPTAITLLAIPQWRKGNTRAIDWHVILISLLASFIVWYFLTFWTHQLGMWPPLPLMCPVGVDLECLLPDWQSVSDCPRGEFSTDTFGLPSCPMCYKVRWWRFNGHS